jgi:hypothetical protein
VLDAIGVVLAALLKRVEAALSLDKQTRIDSGHQEAKARATPSIQRLHIFPLDLPPNPPRFIYLSRAWPRTGTDKQRPRPSSRDWTDRTASPWSGSRRPPSVTISRFAPRCSKSLCTTNLPHTGQTRESVARTV